MPYVQGKSLDHQFFLDIKNDLKNPGIKLNSKLKHFFIKSIKINVEIDNKTQTLYLDFKKAKAWARAKALPTDGSGKQLLYQIQVYQNKKNETPPPYLSAKCENGVVKLEPWSSNPADKGIKLASLTDYLFFRTVKLEVVIGDLEHKELKTIRVNRKNFGEWAQIHLNLDATKFSKKEFVQKVNECAKNLLNPPAPISSPSEDEDRKGIVPNGVTPPATDSANPSPAKSNPAPADEKPKSATDGKPKSTISGKIKTIKPIRSYSKTGALIPHSAQLEKCLILDNLEDDPRFFVKTTQSNAKDALPLICKDGTNEKLIHLDMIDLSNRLHLSVDKIKKANDKGELSKLIEKKVKKREYTSQVLEHYSRFYEKMSVMPKPDIKPETLMKVIRTALMKLPSSQKDAEIQELQKIIEGDRVILVGIDQNKKLHLLDYKTIQPIGEGSCGNVFRIKKLCSDKFKVMKIAILPALNDAILAEYTNAHHFQGNGIQKAPNLKFKTSSVELQRMSELNEEKKSDYTKIEHQELYGLLTHEYDGDLLSCLGLGIEEDDHKVVTWKIIGGEVFRSQKDKYQAIYELICNFESQYKTKKMHHSDLKLQNIFYFVDQNKKVHLKIGDLEGASCLDEKRGCQIQVVCKNAIPFDDAEAFLKTERENSQEAFNQVAHKMDVYALGVVCYEILTRGGAPYDHSTFLPSPEVYNEVYGEAVMMPPKPSNKVKFNKEPLVQKGVPEPLIDILSNMLNLDYNKRYSISKAKEKFQEIEDLLSLNP